MGFRSYFSKNKTDLNVAQTQESNDFDFSRFRDDNWSKLDYPEKIALLREAENYNAAIQGRPPCHICPDSEISNGGYFTSQDGGEIHISEDCIDNNSYRTLEILFHEGRHAYQNDVINHPSRHDESPETVKKWDHDNGAAYISPRDEKRPETLNNNYCDYFYQSQERDAYNFAEEKMNSLDNIFGDDPKYHDYKYNRDYNRAIAYNQAVNLDHVSSEDEAAANADALVEQRYAALMQNQASNSEFADHDKSSKNTYNADNINYGQNNTSIYNADNSDNDLTYVDEEYHQEKGLVYGGNGTVTKPKNNEASEWDEVNNQFDKPQDLCEQYLTDYEKQLSNDFLNDNTNDSKNILEPIPEDSSQLNSNEENWYTNVTGKNDVEALDSDNQKVQNGSEQKSPDEEIGKANENGKDNVETLDFDNQESQNSSEQKSPDEEIGKANENGKDNVETLDFDNQKVQNGSEQKSPDEEIGKANENGKDNVETLDFDNQEAQNGSAQKSPDEEVGKANETGKDDVETLDFDNQESQNSSEQKSPDEEVGKANENGKDNVETLDFDNQEGQNSSEQKSPDEEVGKANETGKDDVETLDFDNQEAQNGSEQKSPDEEVSKANATGTNDVKSLDSDNQKDQNNSAQNNPKNENNESESSGKSESGGESEPSGEDMYNYYGYGM